MATLTKTTRVRPVDERKGLFATSEEASLAKNADLLIALKRFKHQLSNQREDKI